MMNYDKKKIRFYFTHIGRPVFRTGGAGHAKLERVKNIPLGELHPFKDHPFKIQNNEEMQ